MELLAIDLGMTSGFAYYINNKVRHIGEFTDPDEAYLEIRTLGQPAYVVVEKPIIVKGELGDDLAGLIARTEAEFGDVYYVTSSQWKPHPQSKAVRKKLGRKYSAHEKDAICIGAWFLFVHLQVEA